ncbi:MAG: polymer-forming cytoskeletal protein [Azospirillaceae bacterium]
MLRLRGGSSGGGAKGGAERPGAAPAPTPPATAERAPVRASRGAPEPTTTRIAAGLVIVGDLYSDDPVEVAGWIEGVVAAPSVTVERGGAVHGGIQARTAEIRGAVSGRVEAFTVSIRGTAEVSGNVLHHEIEVERGAKIDGPMPWRPKSYFDENAGRDVVR